MAGGQSGSGQGWWHQVGTPAAGRDTGLFTCPEEDESSVSPAPGHTVASDPGAADRKEQVAEKARGGGGGRGFALLGLVQPLAAPREWGEEGGLPQCPPRCTPMGGNAPEKG